MSEAGRNTGRERDIKEAQEAEREKITDRKRTGSSKVGRSDCRIVKRHEGKGT